MTTGAHLAAYLSGDLDPDEHAALEAELARDPALRTRLDRVRRADRALADLPEVELPESAERRLHAAVSDELDTLLGDELAARRARRGVPRWVPAAAAAALVVVVGGGVVLTGGMGGSDQATDDGGAAEGVADLGGELEHDAADSQVHEDTESAAPLGPRIVATERTLDEATVAELAADPTVLDAVGSTSLDDPAATAAAHARALGTDPDRYFGSDRESDDGAEAPGADRAETASSEVAEAIAVGEVTAADREDVAACLPVLQQDATGVVVPLYAELGATEDGTEAIAYAALGPDEDGDHQRIEVWLVDRSSCSLLRFVQHDR